MNLSSTGSVLKVLAGFRVFFRVKDDFQEGLDEKKNLLFPLLVKSFCMRDKLS